MTMNCTTSGAQTGSAETNRRPLASRNTNVTSERNSSRDRETPRRSTSRDPEVATRGCGGLKAAVATALGVSDDRWQFLGLRRSCRGAFRTKNSALLLAATMMGVSMLASAAERPSEYLPQASVEARTATELDPTTHVNLIVTLPFRDRAVLDATVAGISDPKSESYRHFLTPTEFQERFAPAAADLELTVSYLKAKGLSIASISEDRQLVHVSGSAGTINRAFNVTLRNFVAADGRTFFAPDREPFIDDGIPILHIAGLHSFSPKKPNPVLGPRMTLQQVQSNRTLQTGLSSQASPDSGSSSTTGPFFGNDFRKAYAPGVAETGRGQLVGILAYEGYQATDVNAYEAAENLSKVPLVNVFMDGFNPGVSATTSAETSLDIEDVIAMAPHLNAVNIYGVPDDRFAIDALHEMANPTKGEGLPRQISTSWEMIYDSSIYQALKQFVVQGQAFFSASGDSGAYTPYNSSTATSYVGPFTPADHPYVTAVGGTELTVNSAGGWASETTWPGSGGGPSPWAPDPQFTIPSWQIGLANSANHASTTARNVPDVAMPASNVLVSFDGGFFPIGGTSAASPLWAGMMALANERAQEMSRLPIGFANPPLYAIGRGLNGSAAFHDIKTGSNAHDPVYGTNGQVTKQGSNGNYLAVPGYDLTTGWGSPAGSTLINSLATFGWDPIPGGGTTNLPQAVAVLNGNLYVVAIGINDHRHYVNKYDGSRWAGWSQIPGGSTTTLADSAVVFEGRIYLFGIGTGDHAHYMNSFDGNTWAGWSLVPGGATTSLADAATVFNGRLYLFGIGTGDHGHYMNSFNGTTWAGWSKVPGGGTTVISDTATEFNGRLYLFGIGIGDHAHYVNSFDGSTWTGWSSVPGGGTTALPDTATVFNGQLQLFSVGITNHAHYKNSFDGTRWSGWSPLSAGGTTGVSDAAATYQGQLLLFSVGLSNHQSYFTSVQ